MYPQHAPERIEIHPAKWRLYSLMAALIIFSVVGVLVFLLSESYFDRCMGLVAVAFFGGGGAIWVLKWQRKEHFRVALAPGGLEIYLVGAGWHTIPWKDIERFDTTRQGNIEFTTVRLQSYESLLSSISPEQAEAMMRLLPAARIAVHGTAGLAAATGDFEGASELADIGRGMHQINNLQTMLRHTRDTYGSEFLLPWSARDRSAGAFATFLDNYRRNHM